MNIKNDYTKFNLAALLFIVIQVSVFGQKPPIKYGKISKADLEMTALPSDTSASAAILCDYGYFNANQLQFVRTLRVKIFKKEGTSWGSRIFPDNSGAFIKGTTFNLENGEIVESKLESESIFREKVTDGYFRTRVAMPNVKAGSVIDIEFSFPGLPLEWRFQDDVPVLWSELIIEPSSYVTFRKHLFGFERLSVNTDIRWVAKEMPAFKKEPFMNSSENYITKYEIELLSLNIPQGNSYFGGIYRDFSTTWDAVNTQLKESNYFGKALQGCSFLNNIAKEIEKNYPDTLERLRAAHQMIKKMVKWNEDETVFSTATNLSYAYNKKIGNSGDINMILIQLLKKLNFEVYPVALSTRNNGFLSLATPSLNKLNYVVACVIMNNKRYLLDATEEYLPVGMLPPRCINLQGRLIDEKKSDWVDLMTDKSDRKFIRADMKLGTDYALSGKIVTINYDYAALDFRNKYGKFNSKEEYLMDFEKAHKGLSIITCNIANFDSIYRPLQESYDVKIKNMVTTAGDLVYINPLLFEQMTSNPFKTVDRKYPVDFIYPFEKIYIFKLELPEGAQVVELPKPLVLRLEDGSATIKYRLTAEGKSVQLLYNFNIDKAIYSESEYAGLRALFSEMVKKHAEQIAIKIR